MNAEEFNRILENRIQSINVTLGNKAKKYAIGDRLYNFKRAAEIGRTSPEAALKGMMLKHIVSVFDLIEGSLERSEHMINEKIGDAINYLILLEAVLKEDLKHTAIAQDDSKPFTQVVDPRYRAIKQFQVDAEKWKKPSQETSWGNQNELVSEIVEEIERASNRQMGLDVSIPASELMSWAKKIERLQTSTSPEP